MGLAEWDWGGVGGQQGSLHKMEASHLLIHGDESARGEENAIADWLEP